MKLEHQVASLELSKKLKDLGVKQESYFYWWNSAQEPFDAGWIVTAQEHIIDVGILCRQKVAAFTVAELIDLLGPKFGVLERFPHSGKFGAYIPNDIGTSATGDKVADVLAQLLMETYENDEAKD